VADGLLYAMGIDPGNTTGVAIIGVHERTIYSNHPGRIKYFEAFDITGNYSAQVIEIMAVASEFFPLALVVETFIPKKPITSPEYLSPVRVAARIEMCVETHYTLSPLFWQSPADAMSTAPDERLKLWGLYRPGPDHIKDGTRHAITFIRRAKADTRIRDRAWGPTMTSHQIVNRGISRSVRRLYYTDGPPRAKGTSLKIGELSKELMSHPNMRVLILFQNAGGPYYSPGDIHYISETEDIAIEADYPRKVIMSGEFAAALDYHDEGGSAILYLPGPHPSQAWFDIERIDHGKIRKYCIVIVVGEPRSTT
jgi:hypothetical protein